MSLIKTQVVVYANCSISNTSILVDSKADNITIPIGGYGQVGTGDITHIGYFTIRLDDCVGNKGGNIYYGQYWPITMNCTLKEPFSSGVKSISGSVSNGIYNNYCQGSLAISIKSANLISQNE